MRVLVVEDEWKVANALREGLQAEDYVFAFAELLARMRVMLRRGRPIDQPQLSVGQLCLDVVTRKVTRAGEAIDVTVREFELLEILMRYQGQVISRETLAREIWKEPRRSTPLDNVIDAHIARLRRKVECVGAARLIHTIRGVGFMLRDGGP
jgi:DNA-binding response OmpR family regulator